MSLGKVEKFDISIFWNAVDEELGSSSSFRPTIYPRYENLGSKEAPLHHV